MVKNQKIILFVSPRTSSWIHLARFLASHGLPVVHVQEHETAEVILSRQPIGMVLMALQFVSRQGLEGIQLVQRVQAHFPHIPIITLHHKFPKEGNDDWEWVQKKTVLFCVTPSNYLVLFDLIQEWVASSQHAYRVEWVQPMDVLLKKPIKMVFQPIVQLVSTDRYRVMGLEGLARFKGPLCPEMVFACAAKQGRSFELDCLCIQSALRSVRSIPKHIQLFLNVQPASLTHPGFVSTVWEMVRAIHHISPKQIVFELTEQQAVINSQAFSNTLQKLRKKGFRIALDDFGAGFSNLEWIHSWKPDFIKLAGSFSTHLGRDISKQVIVRNAVQMFEELQIPLILENIERKKELVSAQRLGVSCAQGFLFQKPVSIDVLRREKFTEKSLHMI